MAGCEITIITVTVIETPYIDPASVNIKVASVELPLSAASAAASAAAARAAAAWLAATVERLKSATIKK